jgi:hypothetical protein
MKRGEPLDNEPEALLRRLAVEELPSAVEDADPARRDRLVRSMKEAISRSAEQTERRKRRWWVAASVASAAAFVLLSGIWLDHQLRPSGAADIAGIERLSGTVVLTQEGSGEVVGGGSRPLRDGDAVETAAGARARLSTSKSSVNVGESTVLKLSRPSEAEERISLRRGRVDVSVDKSIEAKRAVVVETPDAEVVVRGTVFDVRVEPSGGATTTHVHVSKGSVWVLAHGVQVALLSAGQAWSSGGAAQVAAPERAVATAPSAASELTSPATRTRSSVERDRTREPRPGAAPKAERAERTRKASTLTAENELFAVGIEARNRGEAARAAEAFGELLGKFPQTALREAAQVERFRALDRAGQKARAAGEARRYLAEYGDGFAKAEARELALGARK